MRLRGLSAVVPVLLAGLLFATGTAAAATGSHARRLPSPAPTAASQAAALAQETGLTPGQVTTRATCAPAAPGHATCDAHVVVLRSTGAVVRPLLHPQRALADVRAGRRSPTGSPAGTGASGASAADVSTTGLAAPAAGTPAWLQQAYDLSYLSASAGGNQTIGIVDAYNDRNAEADLATFRSTYGLPPCSTANGCFQKINDAGWQSNSGWTQEQSLDLDAVSALCPKCHIILVEAASTDPSDLSAAMEQAVNQGATQISASWTIGPGAPPSEQLKWPGVATVAASGDNGYNNYLPPTPTGPADPGDVYPAALPGVTAVGGTTLGAAGGLRGYGETAWSNTGSGCDVNELKPPYQTDTGCTGRAYADVSADADPATGLEVYDSRGGGWMLLGGTSLATPLVAAFDAVSGVDGSTPAWAYADQAALNDPASGSNGPGLCPQSIFYICNAGTGYDGPTGIGSISGQIANGGPGIGGPAQSNGYAQSVTDTTAALTGGVYPNGYDTTYYWQYGLTTDYNEQTPAVGVGAGNVPVAAPATLPDLSASTTYHYRLVASNSVGTTYGYDYTLTTADPPATPQTSSSTVISTAPSQPTGSSATTPTTPTTPVSTTPTTPAPHVATPPVTPGATSPGAGTSRATPVIAVRPRLAGAARVGATLRVTGGSYRNGAVTAVRFERCARTCTADGRGMSHRVTTADAGYYLRARVTVSGPGGTVSTWANGTIGPIRSKTAGAAAVRPGTTTLRGSAGRTLARMTTRWTRAHAAKAATVELTSVRAIHGAVRVWSCVSAPGTTPSCTAPVTVRGSVTFRLTLHSGQKAMVVAVARG